MESRLLSAVTGMDVTETELEHIGERVWNLMRSIAVLEGKTREKDTLHRSYFEALSEPGADKDTEVQLKAVPKEAFEKAKDEYYRLRDWDVDTGWPTGRKLRELGLEDVAGKLLEKKHEHGEQGLHIHDVRCFR